MDKKEDLYLRYQRQLGLPQVGKKGQDKLFQARVLVVGAGGLGSPVLYYLAAAGIGTLGIVDNDAVEISNLQRQIIHWETDLGKPKAVSAKEKLLRFNSRLQVEIYSERFDIKNAEEIISRYDMVISAVDNTKTRDVINRVCFKAGKPWIEGGVNRFTGVVTTFLPPFGPCYRCLYPEISAKNNEPPQILGTLPGVIGLLQTQEALKIVLGIGKTLHGRLLIFDSLETKFETIAFRAKAKCPVCGGRDRTSSA